MCFTLRLAFGLARRLTGCLTGSQFARGLAGVHFTTGLALHLAFGLAWLKLTGCLTGSQFARGLAGVHFTTGLALHLAFGLAWLKLTGCLTCPELTCCLT